MDKTPHWREPYTGPLPGTTGTGPTNTGAYVEVLDPNDRPRRPTRRSVVTQLEALPQTVFAGANRYDSDDGCWLHLWTADGQSFDIVWRHKVPSNATGCAPSQETADMSGGPE